SGDDPQLRIRRAFADLLQMDPIRQAEALYPEPFDSVLINYVRLAAASIVSLVPTMRKVIEEFLEDDYTALMRELLLSRLHILGWSVPDQSKGGYTAKGNPGERDLVIRKDTIDLAVIEAVVCDRPVTTEWTRSELTSHFQKLVGY